MDKRGLQRLALVDLFEKGMTEAEVEKARGLKAGTFNKWLEDDDFRCEIQALVEAASMRARMIVAQSAAIAARRLVQLTDCEKEETCRRACLDIIGMKAGLPHGDDKPRTPSPIDEDEALAVFDAIIQVRDAKEARQKELARKAQEERAANATP
jgi:hypothetical protein